MNKTRECKECQANISNSHKNAIFCSMRCNQLNWVSRNREKVREYRKIYGKKYYRKNIDKLKEYHKNYNKLYR